MRVGMSELGQSLHIHGAGAMSPLSPIATESLHRGNRRGGKRSVRLWAQRSDEEVASELAGSHTASTTIG